MQIDMVLAKIITSCRQASEPCRILRAHELRLLFEWNAQHAAWGASHIMLWPRAWSEDTARVLQPELPDYNLSMSLIRLLYET